MNSEPNQEERPKARFFARRPMRSPQEALHPEAAPPPPSPASKPQSKRRPRLGAASGFLSFLLVAAIGAVTVFMAVQRELEARGPLASDQVLFIAPRTEVVDIIEQLKDSGIIASPTLLKAALWIEGRWHNVKAGEYLFRKEASLRDVMDTLVSGRQLLHSVTVPEGLTSEQIVQRLMEIDVLVGEVTELPREGTILPETYRVPRGMSRADLIRKMQLDQNRIVDQIWARRAADLPIRSKFELVTLASIVEKETGRADERTRVASVFHNRLNKRMRLQSDPTIVYGIVGGKGTLGRPILRSEITRPTAYNTYTIDGLPPGPIANPGRAALEAVANPSRTRDLFFVADGTGGHVFAESYEQHNRNVARWREIERDAREKAISGEGGAIVPVDRALPVDDQPAAGEPRRPQRRGDLFFDPVYGGFEARIKSLAGLGSRATTGPLGAALLPVEDQPRRSASSNARAFASKDKLVMGGVILKPLIFAKANQAPANSRFAATNFNVGPSLEDMGIAVRGVNAPAFENLLDGPASSEIAAAEPEAVNLAVEPVDGKRLAQMQERAARFGVVDRAYDALPIEAGSAGGVRPNARLARVSVVDASEGTEIDPLLIRKWDLNSVQTIPAFR